jgi:hypothetical protein
MSVMITPVKKVMSTTASGPNSSVYGLSNIETKRVGPKFMTLHVPRAVYRKYPTMDEYSPY